MKCVWQSMGLMYSLVFMSAIFSVQWEAYVSCDLENTIPGFVNIDFCKKTSQVSQVTLVDCLCQRMHNMYISLQGRYIFLSFGFSLLVICSSCNILFFHKFSAHSLLELPPLRRTLSSYIQHGLIYDIDCSASVCQVVLELEPINC